MIYEASGRAREYFELAANLYTGCEHGCVYCYGADVLHVPRAEFYRRAVPRQNGDGALASLAKDAERMNARGDDRHVLLSFVTDPYQQADVEFKLTRRAIEELHRYGIPVAILTKGGFRATRDFDLLGPADLFGTTLTFMDPRRSRSWEPGAALPIDRMKSLEDAHARGIGTWVSLEPVIDPGETLQLIEATAAFVDHYKVGTLNYAKRLPREFNIPRVDWRAFARSAMLLLNSLGKAYYIKKDLARYLGEDDGKTVGEIPK